MIYKVGVTGGIGCGKSTICSLFTQLGIPSFSADAISHQLSHSSEVAFKPIVETFGHQILSPDGEINRKILGDIIFEDTVKKKQLETILHPLILHTMHTRAEACKAPYCVLDIPLLVNTPERDKVDRILLVDCNQATRIKRILKRNNWSKSKIAAVMRSQSSEHELHAAADDVIDNQGNISSLMPQVETLHARYLDLSSNSSNKG